LYVEFQVSKVTFAIALASEGLDFLYCIESILLRSIISFKYRLNKLKKFKFRESVLSRIN
ncbi:MAG: hypothetical protein ACFFBY_14080, partial [Promethearchaeota archaeon]